MDKMYKDLVMNREVLVMSRKARQGKSTLCHDFWFFQQKLGQPTKYLNQYHKHIRYKRYLYKY
jgi:hypothetical protein